MVEKSLKTLIKELFLISILGFGGGAAVIPLFHKQFVDKHHWFSEQEFQNILTISNTLPGPIQTKFAGYIGFKTRGILGLILGLLTIITPSLLFMILFFELIVTFKQYTWIAQAISGVYPVVTLLMLFLVVAFVKKDITHQKRYTYGLLLLVYGMSYFFFDIHPAVLILFTFVVAMIPKLKTHRRILSIIAVASLIYLLRINARSFEIEEVTQFDSISPLFKLMISFFIPGVIGYGGGPGSLSLIAYETVEQFQLLTARDFSLIVGIQSMLPGVTATKVAGMIGYQTLGLLGLFVSISIYVLPSMILMILFLKILNTHQAHPNIQRFVDYVTPLVTILLSALTIQFFELTMGSHEPFIAFLLLISSFLLLKPLKLHPFFVIVFMMTLSAFI